MMLKQTVTMANARAATADYAGVFIVSDSFANAKDGESWVQLSPFGKFPNQAGLQVFTPSDAQAICNEFKSVMGTPQRVMGVPFYIGHPDHPSFKDQYKDTRSFGRIKELECRHDDNCAVCSTFANARTGEPCSTHGLYGKVKWNDDGKQIIANEMFNGHSVNWRLKKVGGEWHPFSLKSVGFTNEPNIPVNPILAANETATDLLERRFCRMTVMRELTPMAANAKVRAYRKMSKTGKVFVVKEHERSDELLKHHEAKTQEIMLELRRMRSVDETGMDSKLLESHRAKMDTLGEQWRHHNKEANRLWDEVHGKTASVPRKRDGSLGVESAPPGSAVAKSHESAKSGKDRAMAEFRAEKKANTDPKSRRPFIGSAVGKPGFEDHTPAAERAYQKLLKIRSPRAR